MILYGTWNCKISGMNKANSIHRIPLFNIGTIGISDLQFDLPCTKPFLFDQVSYNNLNES